MAASASPFRALGHYRLLPGLVGWPALIVAFLARTPFAMIPLGVMTAFTAATGSVAIGGLATGIASISTAIAAPLLGRVAERVGQKKLLLSVVPVNALGLLGLFILSFRSEVHWSLWALCILTGATAVPVGSFTRSRWVQKTTTPYQLSAAFSYESMADELVFVLGPALVGVAASTAMPSAPLALAFIVMLAAGLPFALTAPGKSALPTEAKEVATEPAPPIFRVIWTVILPIAVLVCVGAFFGSSQAAITERADQMGMSGQAGLVYAVMGIGSAISALMVVVIPERFAFWKRIFISALGMAVGMVLIALAPNLGLTALFMGLTGFFIGPTLVTAFSLTERMAPPSGMTVAMTTMSSSVTVGVAFGSSVGGALAARAGAETAFLFGAGASALIVVLALLLATPKQLQRVSRN
ncbi:MFS transporter [Actinomyces sp. F1_1611]